PCRRASTPGRRPHGVPARLRPTRAPSLPRARTAIRSRRRSPARSPRLLPIRGPAVAALVKHGVDPPSSRTSARLECRRSRAPAYRSRRIKRPSLADPESAGSAYCHVQSNDEGRGEMKTSVMFAVVAALSVAVVGSALGGGSAARATSVATASSGLGRIVVDGRGRTLYLFEKDKGGKSACSGVCSSYWPPLVTSGKSIASKGAEPALLGSIRRAGGTRQVTYAGHPLYCFSGDSKSGQTNGEGLTDFGASWYVLAPSGKKIDRD